MPCEGCKVQFTVFRRKRICADCRRFFCSNCLTSKRRNNNSVVLCERCSIFAKRPLLKIDLAQLKPKDLIFYLQSKHISTTGCVEKDELVGLVLNHVNANANESFDLNSGSGTSSFSGPSQGEDNTNSFDNIKQTCQNFFTSLTDRVDLNFDTKSSNRSESDTSSHISDQPRVSVREIPTYSSMQNQQDDQKSTIENPYRNDDFTISNSKTSPTQTTNSTPTVSNNSSSSSQLSSPNSLASICSSQENSSNTHLTTNDIDGAGNIINDQNENENKNNETNLLKPIDNVNQFLSTTNIDADGISGCECSDDEIIENFNLQRTIIIQNNERLNGQQQQQQQQKQQQQQQSITTNTISPTSLSSLDNQAAGPSGCNMTISSNNTLASGLTTKSSLSLKIESLDESSESSFEDIGAIGGIISNDAVNNSKVKPDDDMKKSENWEFIQNKRVNDSSDQSLTKSLQKNELLTVALLTTNQLEHNNLLFNSKRPKKVLRRRSDGYLNRRRYNYGDDDDDDNIFISSNPIYVPNHKNSIDEKDEDADIEEHEEEIDDDNLNIAASTSEKHFSNRKIAKKCCKRCGKTKFNIKKRVAKLQQQLKNTEMSEDDIKHELEEFLHYLEYRSKSIDCNDSVEIVNFNNENDEVGIDDVSGQQIDEYPEFYDENEGIHVYPDPSINSRFINLENFDTVEEIQNLSVKQLKEVLMLNRVDYKGCCEKQELFERVIRLWNNLKSCPAVEKLQTDELCKICMDAPIECVILECGHMATCTNCGKVLSECPICRQYIVRVVRFFRA